MIQKHLLQLCSWTFLLLCFQRASVHFCAVNIGSCCVRCVEAKRGRFAVANVKKNSGCSGKSPGGVTQLPSNRALLVEHNGIQKLKRLQWCCARKSSETTNTKAIKHERRNKAEWFCILLVCFSCLCFAWIFPLIPFLLYLCWCSWWFGSGLGVLGDVFWWKFAPKSTDPDPTTTPRFGISNIEASASGSLWWSINTKRKWTHIFVASCQKSEISVTYIGKVWKLSGSIFWGLRSASAVFFFHANFARISKKWAGCWCLGLWIPPRLGTPSHH